MQRFDAPSGIMLRIEKQKLLRSLLEGLVYTCVGAV